jgi:hypothetical protein
MNIFKKLYTILPITILFLLLTTLLPSTIHAAQFHFKSYTLTQDEKVDDDIYAVGESVKIDGVVNGDVIAFGDTVQVNGTITGDVYLMGGKINIDATIYGNTFVFGNNTSLDGLLSDNTYIGTSILNYNADTQGDLMTLFMESNMKGSIGDDLRAVGFRSNIDSVVRGDAILIGEQHSVNEVNISGDIFYNSTLEAIAKEQGVDFNSDIDIDTPELRKDWNFNVGMKLLNLLSMLLVGYIIITLTPVKSIEIRKRITDSTSDFAKSLTFGFLTTILLPLPLIVLALSLVGAPLALLITGVLSFIFIFGKVWVELAFGKEILELFGVEEYRPFKSFLIGRIISILIGLIPIAGGIYNSIVAFVALGAIIRMKKYYFTVAKEKTEIVKKKKTTKKK